jgi:hypothetical protein
MTCIVVDLMPLKFLANSATDGLVSAPYEMEIFSDRNTNFRFRGSV